MPAGRGLCKTAMAPGHGETRAVIINYRNEKDGPILDLFYLRQGEPGTPKYIPKFFYSAHKKHFTAVNLLSV